MNALNNGTISAKDGLTRPRFRQRNRDDDRGGPIARPQQTAILNWRTLLKNVRVFSVSVLFTLASGFATPTFAADIEIYSDTLDASGTLKPNILFMLDNSESMKFVPGEEREPGETLKDENGAVVAEPIEGEKSRLHHLREAMVNTIEAIKNNPNAGANIGIGRFTHTGNANSVASNAPIIFPIIPDPNGGILQRVSVPVRQSQDDAMENDTTGEMNLTSKALLVVSDLTVTVGSSTYEVGLDPKSNAGQGKTWKYYVRLIEGSAGNLSSWMLAIADSCKNVISGSVVSPDNTSPTSNLTSGLGWDIDSDFEEGVFEFTLDRRYPSTSIDVQINGSVQGEIVGPNCSATTGSSTDSFDPYTTLINDGQFKVSVDAVDLGSNIKWTYQVEALTGDSVSQFALSGPEGTGNTWWNCQNKTLDGSTKITIPNNTLKALSWSKTTVTFTKDYPVGYIEAWVAGSGDLIQGDNPIIGPVCANTTTTPKKTLELECTGEGCVGEQSDYQIDLSVDQNVWTYHVEVTGNNLVRNWALDLPASCFAKLEARTSDTYTKDEGSNRVKWTVDENFTAGDFLFKLNSTPVVDLNNHSVPVGKVGVRLPNVNGSANNGYPKVKSKHNFDFVGPGYCDEAEVVASTCPVLDDSENPDGKMTICHIPPGNPENAHTIEISKNAWPAHSRNHGDIVGQCFKDIVNDDETVNQNLWDSLPKNNNKITICHVPPGNEDNPNTKSVGFSALDAHLTHGNEPYSLDTIGECDSGPTIVDGPCPEVVPEKQLVGLRFEYIDIPQGATITSAKISLRPSTLADNGGMKGDDTFVINAEQAANASSFGNTTETKISSRTLFGTDKEVAWEVSEEWWKGETHTYDTPALTDLVQSLVNQTDWCGGNSMAFVIKDENGTLRRVWSYDGDPDLAPRLEVEFTTTSENEGCIEQSLFTQISAPENDAEEILGSTGQEAIVADDDAEGSKTLEVGTSGGNRRMVGLRFNNVPIFSGTDNILEAHLILRAKDNSNANDGSTVNLTITGEAAVDSQPFEATLGNLTSRPKMAVSEPWSVTEPWQTGLFYRSGDIKDIVQQMVSQTDWDASENSMTFFLTGENGTGTREAVSFDTDPLQAATLHVKVNGRLKELTSQDSVPIIIDKMMKVDAEGLTPIVDALYESLMYFQGGEVTYGKDRENQNYHLISVPESYTHQPADLDNPIEPEFLRDEDCNMLVNPFEWACRDERIKGEQDGVDLTPMYNSPIEQLGDCKSHNYIVLLTDGEASFNQSAANNGLIKTLFDTEFPEGMAGNNECNTFGDFEESNNEECGIALAKFLHEKNDVVTHTVSFGVAEGTDPLVYLDEMAKVGGSKQGVYKIDTSDPSTVEAQLTETFVEIVLNATKGTSSFAPAGIAISRFNRMRHDNEVYYALFENATTRSWLGNVKKFEFKQVDTTSESKPLCADDTPKENCQLMLVGKDGKVAVDGPYLSDSAADLWAGVDETSGAAKITEGGAGAKLMESIEESSTDDSSSTTRTILTYIGTPPTVLEDLTSSDDLNQATVDWIKGAGEPHPNRSWLMAESLHSSPTAITYGDHNNSYTKVVVGTNDGLLRMINAETGVEDWAFLPPDLYDIQADLMANGHAADPDPLLRQHIYGMDGTPTVWVKENNTIRLFVGMRRGGHNYYGLDVTTPSAPELMWVIKDSDTGFTNLGQTWSSPKPTRVHSGYCNAITEGSLLDPEDGTCIVLLFGGGYDPALDALEFVDENGDGEPDVPPTSTVTNHKASSSVGNAIYMVHAASGHLLWKASSNASGPNDLSLTEMDYPIPSDLTVLDTDGDGTRDRVYVADVAGQVWRIDLLGQQKVTAGGYVDQSRGGRLAELSATDIANKRQFFYPPAWGFTEAGEEVIALTSGSRVYPKTLRNVQNRIYVIFDTSTWTENADTGREELATTLTESDLKLAGDTASSADKGWYKNLARLGEKGLARPVILKKATENHPNRKLLLFTSYTPAPLPGSPESAGQCAFDEGTSRLYTLNLSDGSPASLDSETDPSDGEDPPDGGDPPGGGGGTTPDGSSPDGSNPDGSNPEDGSTVTGKGINSDINLMYTEDEIDVITGNTAHPAGERPAPQRVFWIQEQ